MSHVFPQLYQNIETIFSIKLCGDGASFFSLDTFIRQSHSMSLHGNNRLKSNHKAQDGCLKLYSQDNILI